MSCIACTISQQNPTTVNIASLPLITTTLPNPVEAQHSIQTLHYKSSLARLTSTTLAMTDTHPEPHQPSSAVTRAMDDPTATDAISPRENDTPSTAARKRSHIVPTSGHDRGASEPVDAAALTQALHSVEGDVQSRQRTPMGSPSRKRQRIYGDRFIPNREGRDLQASFSLIPDPPSPATPSKSKKRTPHGELHFQRSKLPLE